MLAILTSPQFIEKALWGFAGQTFQIPELGISDKKLGILPQQSCEIPETQFGKKLQGWEEVVLDSL